MVSPARSFRRNNNSELAILTKRNDRGTNTLRMT